MKSRSFYLFVILALFLSLLGSAVTVTPARAATTITVDTATSQVGNDGKCALHEAIINANDDAATWTDCPAGSGDDTIVFADGLGTVMHQEGVPSITDADGLTIDGGGDIILSGNNLYQVLLINSGANVAIKNIQISNGNASEGGGIANYGMTTINASTISENKANINGGGIYNDGTLTVTNSAISGNRGIIIISGGGGIYSRGTLTVTNSTLFGNEAANGGGMYSFTRSPTLTNVTFSQNKAINGGGMYNYLSNPRLINTTFFGNKTYSGGSGGGIYNSFSNPKLTNTMMWINMGSCAGDVLAASSSNNLIDDSSCSLSDGTLGNKIGQSYSFDLGLLSNNGGFTQTHALLAGSAAIDAGANCSATDQRGVTRPQGVACDIGAYEFGPIIPVVTASNPSANATLTSLSSITVVFNQDMLDNATANGAENVSNYILVERGANATFDTTSCNGGVVSDDVPQTISTASYNSAGFITSLTLASPLTAGTYRLFVCGTTSVWSAAGLELNNGVNDYTVDFTIAPTAGTGSPVETENTRASALPATGFTPNRITSVPAQPSTLEYAKLGDIVLEIPSLNVKSTIVGVPQANGEWDVTWLGNDVGWLNGTAFPTWTGNSVLTAHVTNASGLEGPFAALKSLRYGDQIIVHFGGAKYVYEVRNSRLARPYSTSFAFESKQDASYLTLITCQGYNPLNESYLFRRVVRAVLIEVK